MFPMMFAELSTATVTLLSVAGGIAFLTAVCVAAAMLFASIKKAVDDEQKKIGKVTAILALKLGLTGLEDVGECFAAGDILGGIKAFKKFAADWLTPDKIDDEVANIISNAMPQEVVNFPEHNGQIATAIAKSWPTLMKDPVSSVILEDMIAEDLLGEQLTPDEKAKLIQVASALGEMGLTQSSAIFTGLVTGQTDLVRAQAQAIAVELSTQDGRLATEKRVLRTLIPKMMEDPDTATWLRTLVPPAPAKTE